MLITGKYDIFCSRYNRIKTGEKEAMAETEKKKQWQKEHTVFIGVKLQKTTDKKILDFLEGKQKQTEIKKALYFFVDNPEEVEQHNEQRRQEQERRREKEN